jgi:colanic acid biosynthesis glycosyl transferase WcaI
MSRPKQLLIYTVNYWPEPTGFSPMTTDLAESLAASGWNVTVLTGFPMAPGWRVYDEYRSRFFQREKRNGVQIVRVHQYVPKRPAQGLMPTWKRVAFDTSLATLGFPIACWLKRPDVTVALGPPLQVGLTCTILSRFWKAPVLYWLQDIVPDAALNVGMLKQPGLVNMARRMEASLYRRVDRVGIISHGFANNLRSKGVPEDKLSFLPNWADLRPFANPRENDGSRSRADLNLGSDRCVLLHAGSVSAKQRLENLIRAMKLLEHKPRFHLLVAGAGNCLESVQQEAKQLRLSNVTFLSTVTGGQYIDLLRAADIHIVNQAGDIVDALIPSKLLTYLPSERPVIAAVHPDSETSHFVQTSGCGVVVTPDSPEELAKAIETMSDLPEKRREMGIAGATYIREHLDRGVIIETFRNTLLRMAGGLN